MTDEDFNDKRLKVDVYHHFDDSVETLISTLNKLLSAPIEIQIISGSSTVPTKVVLIPQTPEDNMKG